MRWLLPFTLSALLALTALPAHARGLIRDSDIEYALRELASPVLQAAGLNPRQVRVLVVNDMSLNAFVADHRHIFLHAGLILKLENARSLQAVIAHEAAHITNGHITRRAGNARAARSIAGLGLALAAAAAASGSAEAAAGLAIGTRSSAIRSFLAHTRAEESSADLSSLRTLFNAGINPLGALEVQEIFRGQELLSVSRQDPYTRSHPLTRDRIRATQSFVAGLKNRSFPDRPNDVYFFDRAKGKLSAFMRAPRWTLRRAKEAVAPELVHMRTAIAYHRQSNLSRAVSEIDKAIKRRPQDPFFVELKGQFLLEGRKFDQAVQVYGQAARMAPNDALILGGLGRAQLASGQSGAALKTLETARARDFSDARILRDLSVAYAKQGKNGMASLVTGERYALQGRLKDARLHAKRAGDLLPRGSGPWQRAQDVLSATRNLR